MKKFITIMMACAALVQLAGAAAITFPDLSSGGNFTLNAGDGSTNTATANIADQATAVLNINGDWHHGVYEVQLGGINYHATQDVTLNIGSSGSVTWGSAWMGDGVPYGGTVVINIAAGGQLINDGSGFGVRPHASDGNYSASWSDLWDAGMLKRDGLGKADLTAGDDDAFEYNFNLVGSIGSAHTLTAIAPVTFVHPGIGLTVDGLDAVKANLTVEPWKTGYEDLLADSHSSTNYIPYQDGTLDVVGRLTNNAAYENDMEAVHNLARLWYFTEDEAYAQKGRDILISWANTQTEWLETPNTYLVQGYHSWQVFEGADILRSTWPGWTQADTDVCKAYFNDVCWKGSMTSVPNPLKSANQGMAQFAPAIGIAIFNEDREKFAQCLQAFRADAAGALGNTLPNGQVGDTGRDAHDQGQLALMAWAAEAFWNQGVDVYSEYDNRLLAAGEYISRHNLLLDTPFIQAGTVYDVYPSIHSFNAEYDNTPIDNKMLNILYTAYVTRQGMSAPYLEKYFSSAQLNADGFCYHLPTDASTATVVVYPIVGPAEVASVTSLDQANLGDCSAGSATYNSGTKTWTVTGRGSSFTDSSADLRFAYLQVTGDATIIAKLTSISDTDVNTRAGVLITETLSDTSKMQAMIVSNPSGDNEMNSYFVDAAASSHNPTGGSGTRGYASQPDPKVPYWLKIERIGGRINSYSSPDGASWSCGESAEYTMGETAYIGLAVSSANKNSTATATFTDVRITGGDGGEASEVPAAPYAIMASPGGDQVTLRWLESFEADRYKIWRSTQSGGPYTLLTEQSGTSFIDTNVVFGTHYYYTVSATNAIGESPLSTEEKFNFPDTPWVEAEDYDAQSGIQTEATLDNYGGLNVAYIDEGDWTCYEGITLGTGAVFQARVSSPTNTCQIEVRLDSTIGTLIGTVDMINTGGWQAWGTVETSLVDTTGTHDIYLVYKVPGDAFNVNWFDIVYPHITEVDIGMDVTITYDPATDSLSNLGSITAWDSTSTHLKLADGSDLSNVDFAALGVTSWKTTNFTDGAKATTWDGASLNGITLFADGDFGAGDSFTGADFSNVVWGDATTTADAAKFFSEGSGAISAANATNAITFAGADLSLISGDARTDMINNLGGFDSGTPIGAMFNDTFLANSGWTKTVLIAAGWQYLSPNSKDIFEAEDYDDQSGINTETCSDTGGGLNVAGVHAGDWCAYTDVDFGSSSVDEFEVRVASATSGGSIELRLDSPTGTLVGTCVVTGTGGWQNWVTKTASVSGASGVHDLYLVFTEGAGSYLFNVNWFTFNNTLESPPAIPPGGVYSTIGNMQVELDWTASTNVVGYDVRRSTVSGSGYVSIGSTTGLTYTDTTVVADQTYYYVVSATNEFGETVSAEVTGYGLPYDMIGQVSSYGADSPLEKDNLFDKDVATYYDTTTAGSYAGLDFGAYNAQQILQIDYTLRNWKLSVGFASNAVFEASNDPDFLTGVELLGTIPSSVQGYPAVNSITITNTTGFRYVRVKGRTANPDARALYFMAELDISTTNSPENAPALPPDGLYSTIGNMSVALDWGASTNVVGYDVKRSTVSGSGYVSIGGTTGLTYTDTTVTEGQTYCYIVVATNAYGENISAEVTGFGLPYDIIGPASSYGDGPLEKDNLFDKDVDTFYDTTVNNSWAGLDFGVNNEQRITQVGYVLRDWGSYALKNATNATFEAANSSDFSDAVTLFTVTPSVSTHPTVNTEIISDTAGYRYVRLKARDGKPLYAFAELDITTIAATPNGTPLAWLESYGLTRADDGLDNDGDGWTTWREYVAGTIPTDILSVLKITSASRTGGNSLVTWQSVEGKTYNLYTNWNLVTGSFNLATSGVPGEAGETSITLDSAPDTLFLEVEVE